MVPVTGLGSLLATIMGQPCQKRWLSPHDLQHVLDYPVLSMLYLGLSHSFYAVHMYFLSDIPWPEVQSHSDDGPVHLTGPCSACALTQARPTMSCIHLALNVHQ